MDDLAPPHNPQTLDQPRKSSPQPPAGGSPAAHLPPHLGLPANPRRSRNTQSQPNTLTSNASRSSSNFRLPPIPPHEAKEVVKESLSKEVSPYFNESPLIHTRMDGPADLPIN